MLYRPQTLHSFRPTPPLVLGACAVVLAVSGLPVPSFLSGLAHSLATPLWSMREALHANMEASTQQREDVTSLTQELNTLRDEVATLRRENFASRTTYREEGTQNLEQTSRYMDERYVVSTVLLDVRGNTLDMLVLDTGTQDGIRDRMLITSPEGVAMGFVERAHSHYSQARLFSSADVTTNAVLYGTTTLPVVLSGHGAGTMSMRIPKDVPLVAGTMVGLPSIHSSALGEVVGIESTPEDAFQTVYVRSPINQYELRYVHIDVMTAWETPPDMGRSDESEHEEVTETE